MTQAEIDALATCARDLQRYLEEVPAPQLDPDARKALPKWPQPSKPS